MDKISWNIVLGERRQIGWLERGKRDKIKVIRGWKGQYVKNIGVYCRCSFQLSYKASSGKLAILQGVLCSSLRNVIRNNQNMWFELYQIPHYYGILFFLQSIIIVAVHLWGAFFHLWSTTEQNIAPVISWSTVCRSWKIVCFSPCLRYFTSKREIMNYTHLYLAF